ncbi:MAG: winged helix-turn-helix transcriptional regulator [Devosiaceae bacterium]|nr:winged helix-turn-helix transcriptional regulator [Devosiaceae bacterium MH13]
MDSDHSNLGRSTLGESVANARLTSMGWHIQRLAAQLDRAMDARLAAHGLTVQMFALVMTVLEEDGLSQAALCARFSAPAYAITRALDQLERDGFVKRKARPTSRRSNGVHATAKSRAVAPKLLKIISDVNADLASSLSDGEQARLLELLQRSLKANDLAAR